MGLEFKDQNGNTIENKGITNIPDVKLGVDRDKREFTFLAKISELEKENMLLKAKLDTLKTIINK